jgi:hypothetical protein
MTLMILKNGHSSAMKLISIFRSACVSELLRMLICCNEFFIYFYFSCFCWAGIWFSTEMKHHVESLAESPPLCHCLPGSLSMLYRFAVSSVQGEDSVLSLSLSLFHLFFWLLLFTNHDMRFLLFRSICIGHLIMPPGSSQAYASNIYCLISMFPGSIQSYDFLDLIVESNVLEKERHNTNPIDLPQYH